MRKHGPTDRSAAAQAAWIEWRADVLADGSKVAPLEVEQAAGDLPWRYWRVTIDDEVILDGARWSWSAACAWIASRTKDGAADGVAAFRVWRGRVWRDLIGRSIEGRTSKVAEAELRNALAGGRIQAKAIWNGEAVTIPADEWPGLDWERDQHGEAIELDRLLMLGQSRYRGVTVARADVLQIWKPLDGWAPDGVEGEVETAPAADVVDVDPADVREVMPTAPAEPLVEAKRIATDGESGGLLRGGALRMFVQRAQLPAGLSEQKFYEVLRNRVKAAGRNVRRDDARLIYGTESYPKATSRGRPRNSAK